MSIKNGQNYMFPYRTVEADFEISIFFIIFFLRLWKIMTMRQNLLLVLVNIEKSLQNGPKISKAEKNMMKKSKFQNPLRQFYRETYQNPQNHKEIRVLYTALAGYPKKYYIINFQMTILLIKPMIFW